MFKVYTETKEGEIDVYFKLVQVAGGVRLIACNATGERIHKGAVCSITSSGILIVHSNVNNSLGLKLDSDACIVVDKEY